MTQTAAPVNGTPTRQGRPAPDDDPWQGDWANEAPTAGGNGRPSGRSGDRRRAPELPPLRTLAERRRRPTGQASHPVLLVSGGDHSGKSYETAVLTGDERIGPAYWMEIGRETTADWYGSVPGADYELIEHDGSWRDIMTALAQSHAEAHELVKAADYDGRPPLLCVDSASGVWEHLSQWAENRALISRGNVEKLLEDPHADIDVGALLWNAANRRHKAFMTYALTWPGPVVLTARGKMNLAVNDRGHLDHKAPKAYSVQAQKDLAHEALMHVRLDAKAHPEVLGYRHPTRGIGGKYGGKTVVVDPDNPQFRGVAFSLAWLLFDVIRYDPATATARRLNDPDPVPDTDQPSRPAVRRLPPAAVPGADEAPGQATAEETEPQSTR